MWLVSCFSVNLWYAYFEFGNIVKDKYFARTLKLKQIADKYFTCACFKVKTNSYIASKSGDKKDVEFGFVQSEGKLIEI